MSRKKFIEKRIIVLPRRIDIIEASNYFDELTSYLLGRGLQGYGGKVIGVHSEFRLSTRSEEIYFHSRGSDNYSFNEIYEEFQDRLFNPNREPPFFQVPHNPRPTETLAERVKRKNNL